MIGRRYQILGELGTGGMGIVYLAADRLTGTRVALKQVDLPAAGMPSRDSTDFGSSTGDRLALAREFQLLASLRHPNIISVLDYGFDRERRPYYTMEVVDEPLSLIEAGAGKPLATQVDLLVQTLHALAYLHRRGVIHRDVKPSNVLVDGSRVKLVDFGISELRGHNRDASRVSGSIPYLAPEVLEQQPFDETSDLYSVGVMAYELLSGRHPYAGESIPVMMMKAVHEAPVISTSDFDARVIPVLQRLLAKDPGQRYREASEAIRDLGRVLGLAPGEDASAIRDSYLKAARLVGRKAEMDRLNGLLKAAIAGRGSAVLVSGESGVGKTRLMDELRTVCLVEGAQVLNGQAVSQGGSPYQTWREILRWLCLLTDVDDTAAAVLKTQVPDVEELVGRPVADAEELDPQAAQVRFHVTVEKLFRQLQTVVVVLEDLHWAGSAGLALLAQLQQVVEHLPVLLVGTYRHDERPDLPDDLPGATELRLERLGGESIAQLSESMLGEAGRSPEILDLLQRETEGNAFFLVEVVRALAEEAGGLEKIEAAALPEQISTGGIDRIIQRRLGRIPRADRALLRQAAVLGRELDLKLLAALDDGTDLDRWLKTCSYASVVDVHSGSWRLAHDRFRERLLHDMAASELRVAHRRAAEAILEVYGDPRERVAALAHHWREAADVADPEATGRAVDYLERAGGAAMAHCANQEAEGFLGDGLKLLGTLPSASERQGQEIRFQVDLGATYLMGRGFTAPEVGQAFGRARSLCEETGETKELMPALLGLWRFHVVRGELETTRRLAEEMLEHSESDGGGGSNPVLARYTLGTTLLFRGDVEPAWQELERCIGLYEELHADSQREVAAAAFFLGQSPGVAAYDYGSWALWCLGYPDTAKERNRQGLALADELGHPFSQAFARTLVVWLNVLRRDDEAAEAAALESIALCKEKGFPYFLAVSSVFHGWILARKGQTEEGIARIEKILDGLRSAGSELFRPFFLTLLAEAYGLAARPEDGLAAIEEALENVDSRGAGWWEPEIYRRRGELFLSISTPDREEAENAFLKALHRARFRKERALELRAVMSLVRLWRGDEERHAKAHATLKTLYEGYTEGFETADLVEAKRLL